MEQADITVIGAGIVGLAVSASISKANRAIYVLERNTSYGQETSSRNSEVIHSGIYYPPNSLKAKACLEGSHLTYEICRKNNIACKKVGKFIIANDQQEFKRLQALLQNGQKNGVKGLKMLSAKEIKRQEPQIRVQAALYAPTTGIVDSHGLMHYFYLKAKAQGAEFVFHSEVTAIKKDNRGYMVSIRDTDGSNFTFLTKVIINCAGLDSDAIAEYAGMDIDKERYRLNFCKGQYFRVHSSKSRMIAHLVYPVPEEKETSLGIHATPDLGGGLRLGPDAEYLKENRIDYNIDSTKKVYFAKAVKRFLPFIDSQDLTEDTCGIRPKLQGQGEDFRDFVISDEQKKGFPGLINLIGIDSPGLTCAAAIGRYIQNIVAEAFSA